MNNSNKRLIRFDWAIKTILRNKVNFPILAGFLSELLHTKVVIESLLESESNLSGDGWIDYPKDNPERASSWAAASQSNQESADDKSNRVDVLAQLASGEKVIIEVQCVHQWDFLSRMLYGVSKVVVEHLKKGDPYGEIPRVISVNIVYFDLGHGKDYIYHGTTQFEGIHQHDILVLGDKEKKHYPNHIDHVANIFPEYYVLKVGQFNLKIKDTLDEWMYALKESEIKSTFEAQGIQEAGRELDILKLSEQERRRYEYHIGNTRDFRSQFETYYVDGKSQGLAEGEAKGLAKGLAEGKAEGKAEGLAEVVKNMHGAGLPIEKISEFVKASKEHIERIIESNKK